MAPRKPHLQSGYRRNAPSTPTNRIMIITWTGGVICPAAVSTGSANRCCPGVSIALGAGFCVEAFEGDRRDRRTSIWSMAAPLVRAGRQGQDGPLVPTSFIAVPTLHKIQIRIGGKLA